MHYLKAVLHEGPRVAVRTSRQGPYSQRLFLLLESFNTALKLVLIRHELKCSFAISLAICFCRMRVGAFSIRSASSGKLSSIQRSYRLAITMCEEVAKVGSFPTSTGEKSA